MTANYNRSISKDLLSFLNTTDLMRFRDTLSLTTTEKEEHNALININYDRIVPSTIKHGYCKEWGNSKSLDWITKSNLPKTSYNVDRELEGLNRSKDRGYKIYNYFECRMHTTFGREETYKEAKEIMLKNWHLSPYSSQYKLIICKEVDYLIAYFYGKFSIDVDYQIKYYTKFKNK